MAELYMTKSGNSDKFTAGKSPTHVQRKYTQFTSEQVSVIRTCVHLASAHLA